MKISLFLLYLVPSFSLGHWCNVQQLGSRLLFRYLLCYEIPLPPLVFLIYYSCSAQLRSNWRQDEWKAWKGQLRNDERLLLLFCVVQIGFSSRNFVILKLLCITSKLFHLWCKNFIVFLKLLMACYIQWIIIWILKTILIQTCLIITYPWRMCILLC
jgi:hypothetical protein